MNQFTLNYESFIKEAYSLGNGHINLSDLNFQNFEDTIYESVEVLQKNKIGSRIIDMIPKICSLNESFNHLNDEQLWELEYEFWESVTDYVHNITVSEGFWNGVVKVTKNATELLGGKAQQFFTKIVSGVGKFIKSAIDAGREALKKVISFGKKVATKIYDEIKSEAEERAQGMTKYPKEEVQKDVNDWKATVDWITGKGMDTTSNDSTKAGEQAVSNLAQKDSEGKENLIDRIENVKNETHSKHKGLAAKIINELRKKSLEPGNETLFEDLIDWSIMMDEVSTGITEATKTKEQTEEKRKEAEQNIPSAEDPLSDLDQEIESKIQNNKKGTNFSKILKFCIEVVLLGPGRMAEELLKILFKGGLKLCSATVRALGGPGVFTFVTVAGLLAFIITLAFDALANFGDQLAIGENLKKIAHFAHDVHMYSALGKGIKGAEKILGVAAHHGTGHAAEHVADSIPFASTIIRLIGISMAASIGIGHLMHYAHESKENSSGKNENIILSFDSFLLEGLNKKY